MTNVTINGNQGYNATFNINGFLGIGTGSLDIGGTVTVSEAAYIGYGSPSDAKVTVTSSTGIWNVGTELFIGHEGPGVLTLGNGGTVSVTGGTGCVTIREQGTLNIGAALTAPMTLDPGTLSASKILFSLDSDPNTPAGTGALNFNHAGTAYTSAAILEGQGTITHAAGTTTLTGSSPLLTGIVKVQGGTLLVNGQIGTAANNTLAVTVEGGGRLGGTGTVGGSVNVKSGGLLVGPTNETLDLGSLVLNADSGVSVTLGAPGSAAPFHIGGDLTPGGVLHVAGTNGFDYGSHKLFTYSGQLTNDPANPLRIGALPMGYQPADWAIQAGNGEVVLVAMNVPGRQYWDGTGVPGDQVVTGGDGVWASSTDNWTDYTGTTNSLWNEKQAAFSGMAGTVTVVNPQAVTSLLF